jgi:hypothetical protein
LTKLGDFSKNCALNPTKKFNDMKKIAKNATEIPGKFREHLVVTQEQLMLVARVRLVVCSRCHDTIIASEKLYYGMNSVSS